MTEPKLTGFSKIRPLGTSFRVPSRSAEDRLGLELNPCLLYGLETPRKKLRGEERESISKSDEWRVEETVDSWVETEHRGVMQTLDRRISASSDQLDTLRRERRAAARPVRTRSSYRHLDIPDKTRHLDIPDKTRHLDIPDKTKHSKTPFEMFLEDDGPYSRKLYGPVQPEKKRERQRKISTRRVERIQDTVQEQVEDLPRPVKRGLLWQQKDRLFSRWRERYFVLTKDYISCFKKGSSRITEMGGFVFKIKLADIESLELVDKRGYMTIVISQFKEGKILLRTTQGLQDWYNILQAASYESKKRRKFWVTGQGAVEQWLLEKQENLLTTPAMKPDNDVNNNNLINNSSSNNINLNKNKAKESSTTTNINPPRGINRLSLVTDLLMGEVVSEFTSSRAPIQAGSRAPNPGVPRTQGGSRTHIEPVVVPKGGSRDPVVGARIGVMRSNTRVPYRGEIDPSRGANYLDEPSERIRGAPEHEVSRGNFVRGEQDSGVDSGHSVNTSCDSQSENNSGEEDRVLRAADKLERVRAENMKKYDTPDLIKSSDSLIKRLDSFSISTQRLGVQGGRRGRILDCVTPV